VDGLGYACALVLAAVFVRAAAAKLARPTTTAAGFAALGVPAAAALARAVPFVELVTAVALVAAPRVGAVAGLVFLPASSWVLVRSLRSGAPTPCNCFGTARTEPVSSTDLVRNVLLAGLAVVSLSAAGPGVPGAPALCAVAGGLAAGLAGLAGLRRRSRPGPPGPGGGHTQADAP
jgi:uncharacterized membrane protein YphA (DoxX/SURF4 family)